jgi:Acetyltransferases
MPYVIVNEKNIDNEHICCAIGNDQANKSRAQTKKEWLLREFANGLVFKKLDQRGKVFIEYIPIENAWKPLIGSNYYVINCLWVSGQFKGQGYAKSLLNETIQEAKKNKKNGIAVVTSNKVKPFLTDKKFYLAQGFEVVDTAQPYFELLVYKINKTGANPSFTDSAKVNITSNKNGFTFIYSNQCVFMEEYVQTLNTIAKNENIESKIIKLHNCKEAQTQGSPFGTLGIYYKGNFLTHELMTEDKFKKLINETCV